MSHGPSVTPPPSTPVPTSSSNFSLLQFLSQEKLTSPNYLYWICNLRITLTYEKKEYVLDEDLVEELPDNTTEEEASNHEKHHYLLN